jgi:hypothetical protein
VPFAIRIGAATVRTDGISAVRTDEGHRRRGYARRLMEAAVRRMRVGDAALSMLYGIPDFHPKFGYAAAGPQYRVVLTRLDEHVALGTGWTVRPFVPSDLPQVRLLYERATAHSAGAAVRDAASVAWDHLLARPPGVTSECRIVERTGGGVAAYVWRLTRSPAAFGEGGGGDAEALVVSEVIAADVPSATAALAVCRQWAAEVSATREQPLKGCC